MERKKKMKEVFAEIEAMFPANPEFVRIFKQYETDIRFYGRYRWKEDTTKERLEQKRAALLKIARNLNHIDLLIFYYVDNLDGLNREGLLRMLQKLYGAQCDFKNGFYKTDEYFDLGGVGGIDYAKKPEKSQKNP